MTSKILSNEEDLGLDDVESFQKFTPHNKKIKLNRLAKAALDEVIAEGNDNPVKKRVGRRQPTPPVRKHSENGGQPDNMRSLDEPLSHRSCVETRHAPAEETKRPSREYDDHPRRISRDRSSEKPRERWTRKYRSRSRSRSGSRSENRAWRLRSASKRSRSSSKSPQRQDRPVRVEAPPPRRYPKVNESPRNTLNYNNPVDYYVQPEVANMTQWPATAPPPPQWTPNVVTVPYVETPEEKAKKLALIEEEMQSKLNFINQHTELVKKKKKLLDDLELLKGQRREFRKIKTAEAQKVLEDNQKLKEDHLEKLKSMEKVLDMLSAIIRSKESPEKRFSRERQRSRSLSSTSSRSNSSYNKKNARESFNVKDTKSRFTAPLFNYSYYDPEVHWCQPCKEFPTSAKEYLLHLHSAEHRATFQREDLLDLAWHDHSEHRDPVVVDGLPLKRVPIKGLNFFVPSLAWYCKLCRSWMGDLHCASLHLKSEIHANNYTEFIDKNPNWESKWLSDRGQAVVTCGKKEDILKRQQQEQLLLQKKHEDELKNVTAMVRESNTACSAVKPSDTGKGKKVRKRRDRSSSTESSTSASLSSSSSSSSDDYVRKKSKSRKNERIGKFKALGKSKREKDSDDNVKTREKVETQSTFKFAPNVPEKHTIMMPESPKKMETVSGFQFPSRSRKPDRLHEFELKCRKENTKKMPVVLPKSKFPFIGRMPFARKLKDLSDDGGNDETAEPIAPPPPIISGKPRNPKAETSVKELGKETKTTSQQLPAVTPPPPPMIRLTLPSNSNNVLPEDFENALNYIYPVMAHNVTVPQPEPPGFTSPDFTQKKPATPSPPKNYQILSPGDESQTMSLQDMMLLGINAEDMAIQRL